MREAGDDCGTAATDPESRASRCGDRAPRVRLVPTRRHAPARRPVRRVSSPRRNRSRHVASAAAATSPQGPPAPAGGADLGREHEMKATRILVIANEAVADRPAGVPEAVRRRVLEAEQGEGDRAGPHDISPIVPADEVILAVGAPTPPAVASASWRRTLAHGSPCPSPRCRSTARVASSLSASSDARGARRGRRRTRSLRRRAPARARPGSPEGPSRSPARSR
jgi:hypothetical protein